MVAQKIYAQALFELANEKNMLDSIFSNLEFSRKNIFSDQQFFNLFLNPNIKFMQKKIILTKIFTDSKLLLDFFLVLIKKNRFKDLNLIIDSFFDLYYAHKNILHAEISSAIILPKNILLQVKNILEKKFDAHIILKNVVDENIIAGFIIKINETVIDSSLISYLSNLKKHLINLNL